MRKTLANSAITTTVYTDHEVKFRLYMTRNALIVYTDFNGRTTYNGVFP